MSANEVIRVDATFSIFDLGERQGKPRFSVMVDSVGPPFEKIAVTDFGMDESRLDDLVARILTEYPDLGIRGIPFRVNRDLFSLDPRDDYNRWNLVAHAIEAFLIRFDARPAVDEVD